VVTSTELDDLDRALVRLLQEDGRMSYRTMADRLGISEGTARYRLTRLFDEGVVRVVGVADPFKTGMDTVAITGLHVERHRIRDALDRLMAMDEVRYVAVTTGTFDLIIEIVLPNNDDLHQFLVEKLAEVPGVGASDTWMVLRIHKQSYTWLPAPAAKDGQLRARNGRRREPIHDGGGRG
jgi:Lrp/AsnC family transcriptional regulator for asnA, asnC and gidA